MIEIRSNGYCVIYDVVKGANGTLYNYQIFTLEPASLRLQHSGCASQEQLYAGCMAECIQPVNFSFDTNGNIIENAGSFKRLKPKLRSGYNDTLLRSYVVLAELNRLGRKKYLVLTYMFVDSHNYYGYTQTSMSEDEVALLYEQNMLEIHNAIFKNGKLSSFKQHPLLRFEIGENNCWSEI